MTANKKDTLCIFLSLSHSFPRNLSFQTTHRSIANCNLVIAVFLVIKIFSLFITFPSTFSFWFQPTSLIRFRLPRSAFATIYSLFFISCIYCFYLISLFYLNFKYFVPNFFWGPFWSSFCCLVSRIICFLLLILARYL